MKLKNIIILFLSMCCMVLVAVAEDKLVTIWSGNEGHSFKSSKIAKMVVDEADIHAIDEIGNPIAYIKSWGVAHAVVNFVVEPIDLLDECSVENGTISASLHNLEPCAIAGVELITVNRGKGIVSVHFATQKRVGKGSIELVIGEGSNAVSGSIDVIMQPTIQFASFYGETAGPDIFTMPYLNSRPSLGTLTMYIASRCDKVIDINSEDEVRVAFNVGGGMKEDILEAVKCYKWNKTKGDALLITRNDSEVVLGDGFDAILNVRSGVQTGTVVFECETTCITTEESVAAAEENREPNPLTLTLTYDVVNINKDYPIEKIEVNNENIEIDVNETYIVNMSVTPMSSYAFQRVRVDVADPSIVKVGYFEGLDLPIQGLKPGTTTITFSAYNNTELVTKTMTVTVKGPLGRIVIDNTGDSYIFAGSSTTWTAKAYTLSGVLMNNVPMTWKSSDPTVATVANGTVAGVAAGYTRITAVNGVVEANGRGIRVIAAPNAISNALGFQGFYDDGDDIVFLDNNDGYLVITDGYSDGKLAGSYTLNGAYYMKDDAKAPAIGSVKITKSAGEYEYIVTMNVSINISDTRVVSYVVNNGTIGYLPE